MKDDDHWATTKIRKCQQEIKNTEKCTSNSKKGRKTLKKKIHGTNTKHQDQRPNNKYAIVY